VIYRALRDLARDVEKNEKYKNDDHMGAEAATAHSSACNAEITKSDFKNPSKTFFSQEKISLMRTREYVSELICSRSRAAIMSQWRARSAEDPSGPFDSR